MISKKKINDEIVKAIPSENKNKKSKGCELFSELYANIFLCAKKKSGKTCTILKILESCIDEETKVIILCSTISKDKNYKYIIKYLNKKGNSVLTFDNIINKKINNLDEILNTLNNDIETEPTPPPKEYIICDDAIKNEYGRVRRKRYLSPEYILIIDDMSTQLRNTAVSRLLKNNRHYLMKVIISSQYINDISPDVRSQLDYCLLYGGHSKPKLEVIYSDLDLPIPYEQFESLYKDATKEKYNFLYIDRNNHKFRHNFNMEYNINNLE